MDFVDLKTQYQRLKDPIDARIARVLEHGQYIMGPEVGELEERLAAYVGCRHCIAVSSGSDALLIALMALGIGPGDEVITSSFTFIATAGMIALSGATPVFVDIDPRTYNLDAGLIEPALTKRTKAIMPVSLYGQCADFDRINAIAETHALPVIEDAAQSFGATYKDRKSCALSTIGCTSFFPSKPLGCYGDGGACFTDRDDLATVMREIRVHGQARRYHHTRLGVNGRFDTLQAAVLLAKFDSFPGEVIARQQVGQRYAERLRARCANVGIPYVEPHNASVFAQYTVAVNEREAVSAALQRRGIPSAVHYPVPLNAQPAFAGPGAVAARGSTPVAQALAARVLSLPMHPYLDPQSQDRVVEALREAVVAA